MAVGELRAGISPGAKGAGPCRLSETTCFARRCNVVHGGAVGDKMPLPKTGQGEVRLLRDKRTSMVGLFREEYTR